MIVIPQGVDFELTVPAASDLRGMRGIREILVDVLSRYEIANELAPPPSQLAEAERQVPPAGEAA